MPCCRARRTTYARTNTTIPERRHFHERHGRTPRSLKNEAAVYALRMLSSTSSSGIETKEASLSTHPHRQPPYTGTSAGCFPRWARVFIPDAALPRPPRASCPDATFCAQQQRRVRARRRAAFFSATRRNEIICLSAQSTHTDTPSAHAPRIPFITGCQPATPYFPPSIRVACPYFMPRYTRRCAKTSERYRAPPCAEIHVTVFRQLLNAHHLLPPTETQRRRL